MAPLRRSVAVVATAFLLVACAATGTAAASVGSDWQRVGGAAPGGDDFAVIDGVPHVAWTDQDGVHVSRLDYAPGPWQAVGAPFRHAPGSSGAVADASLTSDAAGHPWVAWTEVDGADISQVRVARFDGTAWHEVVGGARPINPAPSPGYEQYNSGSEPQIAFFQGVPYVAFLHHGPAAPQTFVSRLKADGSAWEPVPLPGHDSGGNVRLATAGDHLFLGWAHAAMGSPELRRLNTAGNGWDVLPYPPGEDLGGSFGDIAEVDGALEAVYGAYLQDPDPRIETRVARLGADGSFQQVGPALASGPQAPEPPPSLAADGATPYVATIVGPSSAHYVGVQRYAGGSWESLVGPDGGDTDATSAQLAPGSPSGMWILYSGVKNGVTTWRVAGLGVTLPEPPAPGGGGGTGSGDTGGGGDVGGGGTPGGTPEPPVTPATGQCAHSILGTRLADVLRGTRRSDSIKGGAGRDLLFGYRGNDCLFGGSGSDELHGGRGNDDLNGNAGNDVIFGGPGRDEIAAGSGNDRVDVRGGGSDLVACGRGRDRALIDRDDATRGCESVIVRR
jgi:hypothetical protein